MDPGTVPTQVYCGQVLTEDTIVSLGRIDPERVSVIGRTSAPPGTPTMVHESTLQKLGR